MDVIPVTKDAYYSMPPSVRAILFDLYVETIKNDWPILPEIDRDPNLIDLDEIGAVHLVNRSGGVTKNFLACFLNNGRAYIPDILSATGYSESKHLKGVLSGVTKCVRKYKKTENKKGFIIDWVTGVDADDVDGFYYVSEKTRKSLIKALDIIDGN